MIDVGDEGHEGGKGQQGVLVCLIAHLEQYGHRPP